MTIGVAITCQGVSKRFPLSQSANVWRSAFGTVEGPVFEALKDVSFSVPKGQFVGVLGKNGAGKSTLLRVLGGVYSADEGQVTLEGILSGLYELGLVAHPELTGRAYAERLLTIQGFARKQRDEMIADALEFSELGARFDDPVFTYSAGMAARLYFSVATAGDYEVYLIDEVLSVGDQNFQSKCWRRLRDRVSKGASGILVTHDWAAILRLCETTHVLEAGQIVFSGPSEKAVRYYLYGQDSKETYERRTARFIGEPEFPETVAQGDPFYLTVKAQILVDQPVFFTVAVERMQPGFGWETSMMTRKPVALTDRKGVYDVYVNWDHVALAPGEYRVAVGMVEQDKETTGRYITCDARTWLNGDKAAFRVSGQAAELALPAEWTLEPFAQQTPPMERIP